MAKILIVDDDKSMCGLLAEMVGKLGHEVETAQLLSEGIRAMDKDDFAIVFLDVMMPDGNGLEIIPSITSKGIPPEIIIITGEGDEDGAELAVTSGAWDYIQKTSSIKDMRLSLTRALQYREQKNRFRKPTLSNRNGIMGNSRAINACLDQLAFAAQSDANVLLTGETGTGKELFAQALHLNSSRASRDFVVVDCAALPDSIVESMLFGHEKGAFTGADHSKEGMVKQAHRGTLFLDELGELPLSVQKSFLRVLQEHRFRPLAAKNEIESDFRLVSATNRDLKKCVDQGVFRKDLLFRVKTITIELPPLRKRPEDIAPLACFHAARICRLYGLAQKEFSDRFFEALAAYDWPGNVRELVNVVERVIAEAREESVVFETHLPRHIRSRAIRQRIKRACPSGQAAHRPKGNGKPIDMKAFMDNMKTGYLVDLMRYSEGKVKLACDLSGLSRAHLYKLLREYDIRF